MQTLYLDVSAPRVLLTRLLGRIHPAACFGPTSPVHLSTFPDPPLPGPDWVRVRNHLCGICGSDLHQVFLDVGLDVAPAALPSHQRTYLGHEMVGEVVELGPAVEGFAPGDRVVRWGRGHDCRARGRADLCGPCARGHRVLCERASEPGGPEPMGGGFGDTFITPASTLLPVPESLSDEEAIFAEPAAVAIHAAWRRVPQPGERVLVLGCGTIGFLLLQVLRVLAPECEITAVAQFPGRPRWPFASARTTPSSPTRTASPRLPGGRGHACAKGGAETACSSEGLTSSLKWWAWRGR